MHRKWVALAALMLALAGCSDDEPEAQHPSDADEGDTDTPENTTVEDVPLLTDAAPVVWWFNDGPGLGTMEPDAAGVVDIGTSPTAFAAGFEVVEFLSAPMPSPILIHPQVFTAQLLLSSDAPMVSNHAFDYAVWGGSTKGMPLFAFGTHEAAVAPGEIIKVDIELPFDEQRGIFVPAGESLRLLVAGNFLPGDEVSDVNLHTGGDAASAFTFSRSIYNVDPTISWQNETSETFTGRVTQAFAPTDCDTLPGTTSVQVPFMVAQDAKAVQGELKAISSAGAMKDLDIDLFDGSTKVASGHTPYDDEKFFLAEGTIEGLQGTELTAKVGTCGQGPIDFELVVTQWT